MSTSIDRGVHIDRMWTHVRPNGAGLAADVALPGRGGFFDADSIDVDASIDRGAQKRAQMFSGLRCICLMNSTHRDFRDPNKIESARLVTHPSAPKYILQRRFDLDASIDLAALTSPNPFLRLLRQDFHLHFSSYFFLSSPLLSFPSFPTSDFTGLRTSLRAR